MQWRCWLTLTIMWVAIVALYWSPRWPGTIQCASDYNNLHRNRMVYAREALFGPSHTLPGWYSRELLGTPFWANVQNFPFLPTRLLLLFLDPDGPFTFVIAICLAAILAATFTFLYARQIGLGLIASATAGWTFACCGYFASRIAAGHLPLLEVFCALPLLLWAVEGFVQSEARAKWLAALAISCLCLALAGHPQIPIYSMIAAGVYVPWRLGFRRAIKPWLAMILGVGCAGFVLVPMLLLIARSTRILHLAAPENDIAMPYRRLLGFFRPWLDGAGIPMDRAKISPLHGYPNSAYFWDTFCYIGWAPWIALLVLLLVTICIKNRRHFSRPTIFLIALGVAGIVLALPFVQQLSAKIPGTYLRSPARLIYLTEFALSLALAGGVQCLLKHRYLCWIVPLILIVHLWDLGSHDREFIIIKPLETKQDSAQARDLLQYVRDGRVAIDLYLVLDCNRQYDDVGFFDSIMLAKPYHLLVELCNLPPDANMQTLEPPQMTVKALQMAGAKYVISMLPRDDLDLEGNIGTVANFYSVPDPLPRAQFFSVSHVHEVDREKLDAILRDGDFDLHSDLYFLGESQTTESPAMPDVAETVEYHRPDSDTIACDVTTNQPGYLRIIESYDPGWTATIDDQPATTVAAMDALLAVPVPAGKHEVRFVYHTVGFKAGAGVSFVSLLFLIGLIGSSGKRLGELRP